MSRRDAVTVTFTRRQAEALLSSTCHADGYYDELEEFNGRLTRVESASRRVLDAASARLRDALRS